MPSTIADAGEVVAEDAVVLDAVAAAAEQQRCRCPTGASAATPSGWILNGAPAWKLKLFQKMSLSVMTLSSAGGNFSESSAFGTIPMALL